MGLQVVVQERQRLFREGIVMVLESEPDLDVVGAAATALELVDTCEDTPADVALLELDATEWDTCRLITTLCKRHAALRVIATCGVTDIDAAGRALHAGASAIMPRSGGVPAMLAAVRGTSGFRPTLVPELPAPTVATETLTPREIEVLLMIAAGCTTRESSERLTISPKTVENHKQRIFAKLGVQNQAHAVSVAIRSGLVGAAAAADAAVSGR